MNLLEIDLLLLALLSVVYAVLCHDLTITPVSTVLYLTCLYNAHISQNF